MRRWNFLLLVAVLIIAVPLLLNGCRPRSLVSTSQEIEIGREASQDVERQYRVVTDPQLNSMVNRIGQQLVQCSTRRDITYTFRIIESKDVNAFALPGGWVYITSALIGETRNNPSQLAGVIAHEIGHVAARHHADMIGRQTYAQILVGTLTRGQVQDIAAIFANLSLLRWSRKHEFEADRQGIAEMYRCRQQDPQVYNAQGLINFFGNLLKMESSRPSEFQQVFRTHPVTSDRIERAQQYLADLQSGRESP